MTARPGLVDGGVGVPGREREGGDGGALGRERGVLALRFDVDSAICLERGIPPLLRLGDRLGARFTFFVNMGRSFSWRRTVGKLARSRRRRPRTSAHSDDPRCQGPSGRGGSGFVPKPSGPKLSAVRKLGAGGVLRTALLNPRLGWRYRSVLDLLHREGHELGLHGGSNHAVWQYGLDELGADGLERLLRPALDEFRERYGSPAGFASPGFRCNERVLHLMDREGFVYASDMAGESPFRPLLGDISATAATSGARRNGELAEASSSRRQSRHRHHQVPVNVIGEGRVPVIEQGLARGHARARIVEDVVSRIRERRFALMYGHPYVEGVHWRLLDACLAEVSGAYDVVTVREYLRRWRETDGRRAGGSRKAR